MLGELGGEVAQRVLSGVHAVPGSWPSVLGCVRLFDGSVDEMVFNARGAGESRGVQKFVDQACRFVGVAEQAEREWGAQGFRQCAGLSAGVTYGSKVINDRLP